MAGDVTDWEKMPETDRQIVAGILRGFAIIEQSIGAYWRTLPDKLSAFATPEIIAMCSSFSYQEWIHAYAYDHLEATLGLDTYEAFLQDDICQQKLKAFEQIDRPIGEQLALYSAFGEGVSLYGSFAVLLSICRKGFLNGTAQILSWSVRDELQHFKSGCKLARDLNWKPSPETSYELCQIVVDNEIAFLENCGALTQPIRHFIYHRANEALAELRLGPAYNEDLAGEIANWFYPMVKGTTMHDFFVTTKNGSSYTTTPKNYNLDFGAL